MTRRLRCDRLEDRLTPAVPYVLDPTFGTNGYTSLAFTGSSGNAAIGPDGRIWELANFNNGTQLVRYTADGRLDTTFDGDGALPLAPYFQPLNVSADVSFLAVQPDGRVTLSGVFPDGSLLVLRLTADGQLDPTFGTGGHAVIPLPASPFSDADEVARGLRVLADGSVLVAGAEETVNPPTNPDFSDPTTQPGFFHDYRTLHIARLTPAGQLDQTYGSNGLVTLTSSADQFTSFYKFSVSDDGRATVTGARKNTVRDAQTQAVTEVQVFVFAQRLDAAGRPDATFGVNGSAEVRSGDVTNPTSADKASLTVEGQFAVVQSDGGVVVATDQFQYAATNNSNTGGFTLPQTGLKVVRFDASGQPDTTFGTGGTISLAVDQTASGTDLTPPIETVYDLDELPDGTLQFLGVVYRSYPGLPQTDTTTLIQYTADGRPKALLGGSNFYSLLPTNQLLSDHLYATSAVVDPQGRQVLVGLFNFNTSNGLDPPPRIGIARLIDATNPAFPSAAPTVLASGSTGDTRALAFGPTGAPTSQTVPTPFAGYTGAVHVASADLDNNGIADDIYGIGPGGGSKVLIHLNFAAGTANGDVHPQADFVFDAFESTYTGGVFVAVADIENDGRNELIVTPDVGGSARVQIFSFSGTYNTSAAAGPVDPFAAGVLLRRADFFGIDDPNFRGGATVTAADLDGDGVRELIVAAGFSGGPRVAVYAGGTLFLPGSSGTPPKLVNDFYAFPGDDAARLRNGVAVTAADLNGDGRDDLIFGAGLGGSPRVFAVDAAQLVASGGGTLAPLANFFVNGDSTSRNGVQLVARDLDGDGQIDLAAVAGAALRVYAGRTLGGSPGVEPPVLQDVNLPTDWTSVYVG